MIGPDPDIKQAMPGKASLIAVDWGSSRFRAYLLDENGTVMEKTESDRGVFTIQGNDIKNVFHAACNRWFGHTPGLPVVMCGMIGSREGWVDTGYLKCPVTIQDLSGRLVAVPGRQDNPIFIVPGISSATAAFTDVMRGEETQLFGLPLEAGFNGIICLPGTHSKWVSVRENAIKDFATFLTGELYASIKSGPSMRPVIKYEEFDERAFSEGIRISRAQGGLSHQVFSVRSRLAAGESTCGIHASYLSGLLIGAEIIAGLSLYPGTGTITLTGDGRLLRQYGLAFSLFDIAATSMLSDRASVCGLWKLAIQSGRVAKPGIGHA